MHLLAHTYAAIWETRDQGGGRNEVLLKHQQRPQIQPREGAFEDPNFAVQHLPNRYRHCSGATDFRNVVRAEPSVRKRQYGTSVHPWLKSRNGQLARATLSKETPDKFLIRCTIQNDQDHSIGSTVNTGNKDSSYLIEAT